MTATLRQIQANQRNAQLSTGPRTEEGKAQSRRNALKHGMAGDGVVLPPDQDEAAAVRFVQWSAELNPGSPYEEWLVETASGASVRLEACRSSERSNVASESERAELCWDLDKRAEAESLAAGLSKRPSQVAPALERTKHGRAALLMRWGLLLQLAEDGKAWNEAQIAVALDLMGAPRELRGEGAEALPREHRDLAGNLKLARREIERLSRAETLDMLDGIDGRERETVIGQAMSFSPESRLIHRYATACSRQLHWALGRLLRRDKENGGASPREVNRPESGAGAGRRPTARVELAPRPLADWEYAAKEEEEALLAELAAMELEEETANAAARRGGTSVEARPSKTPRDPSRA